MKYKLVLIALSLILTTSGLFMMIKHGFNYGIDFRGGVKLTYNFTVPTSDGDIQKTLLDSGMEASIQRFGEKDSTRYTIKTKQSEATLEGTVNHISNALEAKYGKENIQLDKQETVGPKVGKELKRKGQLAIFFTLIAMLIYIGVRFDFFFAPGALASLVHDVIIVLGFITFFGKEYNLTILAAILTLVGYSVNDTVIVFDRIREHMSQINLSTIDEVVNRSINETLSRTIITSFTVFIVVLILFIFGGGEIHDFAFCFIIGTITASYSSIFIACPLYVYLYKHYPKWAKALGSKKYR